jgi:phage protein D
MFDVTATFALGTRVPATGDTVDFLVRIGGRPLDGAVAASLLELSVQQTLGQAAHLTLRFSAWDSDTEKLTLVDDAMFRPGNSVDVELGYLNQRTPVFWGEIVGLELEASATERPVVTVNAYDILHRLGRGQRQDSYSKSTYAAIARKIAQDIYGVAVDAEDDPIADPENPIVNQENISDFEFLTNLANEIRYELFADAEGRELVFRKSRFGETPSFGLDASKDLVQLSARLDAAGQLGAVEVRAFDSDSKKPIKLSIDNADAVDHSYGSVPSRSLITNAVLITQEEAAAHAKAELLRIRSKYLTASGSCFGRAELRPGIMIEIAGLGTRFGGPYYVTTTTHTLSATGGYRTSFELEGEPR